MQEPSNIMDSRPDLEARISDIDLDDIDTHIDREDKRHYATRKLNATYAEIVFMEGLEIARTHGTLQAQLYIEGEDYETSEHPFLQGLRWWRDLLGVDTESLIARDLIEHPRINGEPRKRFARRRFWGISQKTREVLDLPAVGEDIGDLGTGVAHAVGEWAWVAMINGLAETNQNVRHRARRAASIATVAGDDRFDVVAEWRSRKNLDWQIDHVVEVETGVDGRASHIGSDAKTLSKVPGGSIWIVPRQSDARDLIAEFQKDLLALKPQHTNITTHGLDEINRRIEEGLAAVEQPSWDGKETAPITRIYSIQHLVDEKLPEVNPDVLNGQEEPEWGKLVKWIAGP